MRTTFEQPPSSQTSGPSHGSYIVMDGPGQPYDKPDRLSHDNLEGRTGRRLMW